MMARATAIIRENLRGLLLLILAFLCPLVAHSSANPQKMKFSSNGKSVRYDLFQGSADGPLLIFLHGAEGPDDSFYREQGQYFSARGYTVLLLHYFDATRTSAATDQNYIVWVQTVRDLVEQCRKNTPNRKIAIVGVSMGAYVALAAGSQGVPVDAMAEWYGGMPAVFSQNIKGMPPLLILHGQRDNFVPVTYAQELINMCRVDHLTCENHIYADQGHGFDDDALKDADGRTNDFFTRILK